MAGAIDELRNLLLGRAQTKPEEPKAQPVEQAPSRPSTKGFFQTGSSAGSSVSEGPATAVQGQQSIISGLNNALSGMTGSAGKPKTGLDAPPSWPGAPSPMGPGDIPVGVPNEAAKVPPRVQRFETAQKMIDGYQNNWSPNPLLIRVLEGGR